MDDGLTEDEQELLRLLEAYAKAYYANSRGRVERADCEAAQDTVLAHYRKAKEEAEKELAALRKLNECVVCGCDLLPDEEPPRCLYCPSGED